MRLLSFTLLFLTCAVVPAFSQPVIVNINKIPAGSSRAWTLPQWSPDGTTVFYTSSDFNGIWRYSISTGTVRQVTADRQSGYGFVVSQDGREVIYRRTLTDPKSRERVQETVVKSLDGRTNRVLATGNDLQLPSAESLRPAAISAEGTALLGIENNKISVMRNGTKRLLDPLGGDGRYLWPCLSPDGSRLVAYDMERGTFVCDADGGNVLRLGRRNAAVWTRDGRWLVYMADRDDGHRVTGSELAVISPDGTTSSTLTATRGRAEMYPRCSPTQDKIVCSTLGGEILILTYRERKR
jgi:Tol biopolymer transport system component